MTNKTSIFRRALAFCIVHCAFCISSASAVTITASATAAVGAGEQTPIEATVSGGTVDHLYLVYQISGSSYAWNTNEMTSVSATVYTGYIPPLTGAVTVEWYVTDGTDVSATTTTTLAANPDYGRYHDGVAGETKTWVVGPKAQGQLDIPAEQQNMTYGWKYVGSSHSNLVAQAPNGSQWKASGVGIGISLANIGYPGVDTDIGMDYPSLYFMNLSPSEMPFIRSPKLEGGVGTIDFRTRLVSSSGLMISSELTLQVAYTDEEPAETDWVDYAVYKYGTANGSVFTRICHEVLNDYSVTYVRILRTGHNYESESIATGRLTVDNFCITKPAADVGIIEKLKNPGYPAADQNILMRCAVTNCVEETPAVNRRVSVKYQYQARDTYTPDSSPAAWSSAEMAYMGKDGNGLDWYEGLIPTQRVGYVWYYYQVDYDGYAWTGTLKEGNTIVNASESLSPAYWDAGADTHDRPEAGTKFQVRPYRSRYGRVTLVGQTQDVTIPEMTLVDNEQWQAIVPVSGYTVVSNYFLGYGYYEDDAAEYEPNPVMWGENNPDALSDPTLAGFLESSHGTLVTNQLIALNQKNYTGFYLYRFSSNDKDTAAAQSQEGDRRYDYIVKKAVYQDFDDWTASPVYYESSLGGLPTLTFTEDFDGNAAAAQSGAICVTAPWDEDDYADMDTKREKFNEENLSDTFSASALPTTYGFIRTGSRIIADRKASNKETTVNKTLALSLNGQVENTSASIPHGLEKITFQARASVDDSNFAMYKNGTAWALPSNNSQIFVKATWQLSQMAPSKPYLSYIFLYQPPDWDEGASWYEVRIIQNDSADGNNNTVRVELWRKDSDAEAPVFAAAATAAPKYYLSSSRAVNVRASNSSNKFKAEVSFTGNTSYQANVTDPVAKSAMLTKGGTIGFGVFDAVPNITAVQVGTSNGGVDLLNSLSATWQDWSYGGKWGANQQKRWTIASGSITRAVPTQTIGLYAANCIGSEERATMSQIPQSPTFTRTVNTLTMSEFTVDIKAWNKKFVQIRYDSGDGGIVLDDVTYYPWRAVTRSNTDKIASLKNGPDYYDWTSVDQQNEWLGRTLDTTGESMLQHWAVLEGWTVDSGAFKIGANFERSRANTNLVQGIVSPELENGIGSCSFSYTASGGKVVYGIERTNDDDGNYNNWTPIAVYKSNAGETGERYAKIGEYFAGRVRVRIYGARDVGALLDHEDCGYDPAWGFTDDTAKLLVDNLRVKDYPRDVDDNAWNAYNLLITGDAPDGQVYNNSGKSCFFNNSPTNGVYGIEEFTEDDPYLESPPLRGVGVGEIAFQYRLVPGTASAGTDGSIVIKVAPDRHTPIAEWKTLTNVVVSASGTAFVKFDNEKIFDEKNFVVRFYNSKRANTPRFVIDNVLVTAPARASFEFEYVKLLPGQPLAGTNTLVEAKIMREVMNPKNIRIWCSYHKYETNETWGVASWFDANTSPKVELKPVAEKVYRTEDNSCIPAFEVDDIVEFVVWGQHADIHLNAGDSPIIQDPETFELPEWYKTLDINEGVVTNKDMNVDKVAEGWSPYFWVYSCAPGTFFVNEINNWRTSNSYVDRGSPEYIEFVGPAGTDIGGWKLMVVKNGNEFEYTVPAGKRLPSDLPAGWGFFTWSDAWVANANPPRFRVDATFPNSDTARYVLMAYGGVLVYRSNGMIEQMIRYGDADNVSGTYWVDAGRKQNNVADSLSLVSKDDENDEMIAGRTVNDFTWSRASQTPVDVNGGAQLFADLGGGVVVALYDPDGNEITDEDVLDWIAEYGAEQSDIDELTMAQFNEDFLLNLDLTKTCVAELKITSIQIADGSVILNVQLTRTEDGTPVGTRAVNGKLKLQGRASLSAGAFATVDAADVENDDFGVGNYATVEYELPVSNAPSFFKVIVE